MDGSNVDSNKYFQFSYDICDFNLELNLSCLHAGGPWHAGNVIGNIMTP